MTAEHDPWGSVTDVTRGYSRSLRTRFLLAMLVGQVAACLVILIPVFRGRDQLILSELQRARLSRLSVVVSPFLESMSRDPEAAMRIILEALSGQPDVLYAAFLEPSGPVAGRLPPDRDPRSATPDLFRRADFCWVKDQLEVILPVVRVSPKPLALVAGFDTAPVIEHMDALLLSGVALGIGALTIGLLLTVVLSRHVESSQLALRETSASLAAAVEAKSRELQSAHERLIAADRLATVGRMAAEVAHEIRSPLTAITLELDTIEEIAEPLRASTKAGESSNQLVAFERGLRVARTALGRIDSLLEGYLRFEQGTGSRVERLDARELVELGREVLRELTGEDGTKLSVTLEGKPPTVSADVTRLRIVLRELLKNSLQACSHPASGLDPGLRMFVSACDGGLVLRIEDDAGGIPSAIAGKAIEPFVSTRPNRSGLGLPLALQIIRDLGGDLKLESTPGRGTRVRIRLPAAPPEKSEDPDDR